MPETVVWPLAAILAVWVWTVWAHARAAAALPPARGARRDYPLASGLWWMGAFLSILGPGLALLSVWLIPIRNTADLIPATALAFFLGGVGGAHGYLILRTRVSTDDHGLRGVSLWGLPRAIPWVRIRAIDFRHQAFCFVGGERPVYVPVQLHDWPGFLAEIELRLPHLPLPSVLSDASVRADGERLAEAGHWQDVYAHAHWVFGIAVLVALLSSNWVELHWLPLAYAAAAGPALSAYALTRPWLTTASKPIKFLGEVLQFGGVFVFTLLANRAAVLYEQVLELDPDDVNARWWASLILTLSVAIMSGAGLLLLAKRLWPARYTGATTKVDG